MPMQTLGIVKALDVVEDHRRTLFGRTHNGAAGADVTIDTRDLGVRVDLGVGLEQLARHLAQKVERGAQVVDLGSIGGGHSVLLSGECPGGGSAAGLGNVVGPWRSWMGRSGTCSSSTRLIAAKHSTAYIGPKRWNQAASTNTTIKTAAVRGMPMRMASLEV